MNDSNDKHTPEPQHMDSQDALFATSSLVERLIERVNRGAPINLEFITLPLGKASVLRIQTLEKLYASFGVFRFLVRKGVNPVLLFVSTSAALVVTMKKFYKQSNYLAINLVGVGYPLLCCWQLVKERTEETKSEERLQQHQAWLTYWILYGILQVLDNWSEDIHRVLPRYNLYKLLFLYWAQDPHSNGAALIHRHVIQKPIYDDDSPQYYDPISNHPATLVNRHRPAPVSSSSPPSYNNSPSLASSVASSQSQAEERENLTLTLERHHAKLDSTDSHSTGIHIRNTTLMLDGYTPPPLHRDDTLPSRPKQDFPMLGSMETESSAW